MALRDILAHFAITVDQTQLIAAQQNVNKLIGQFNGLARVATFALGALGTGRIVDSFDRFIELENRLKAATKSTEDFAAAQKSVFEIARATATPVADVTEQFQRYNLATENLGASQAEVLDFTKRVNQATKLGGATAQETRGALIQLAQGLGTNFKAAGQEIRSIQKSAPLLAKIIANAAGGTAGELTAIAKAGKLTSKLVFDSVREAGEMIDKEFAKRKLRYEDISTLFGIEWLALIKQLEPVFSAVISKLTGLVKWTREWIKDGSAINAVVAGLTTTIIALTYAFGGLALKATAAAAPFLALFYALDEIVAFTRGDESFLEDWLVKAFGVEKMEAARKELQKIKDLLGGLFAAIGSSAEFDMMSWRLERAITAGLKRGWDAFVEYAYNSDNPISSLIRWSTAKKDTKPEDKSFFQMTPGEFLSGALGRGDEYRKRYAAEHPELALPTLNPTEGIPTMPAPWAEPSVAPTRVSPYGQQNMTPVVPVINNNITVEGNADAQTARSIATQTGTATAEAYGRSRDAIGAGLGMSQ